MSLFALTGRALLRSPTAWLAVALLAVLAWAAVSTGQARAAAARADDATAVALAERDAARSERDAAQAANALWQATEQRRAAQAYLAQLERDRLLAEQRQRMAQVEASRREADAALARFIDQFRRAPDACTRAAAQMEAACPTLADY